MNTRLKFNSLGAVSSLLLVLLAFVSSGTAQMVTVEKTVTVEKNILDNGTLRSGLTWTNSGISVIDLVALSLNVSSPFSSNPANLGDLSASLRHGNSAETYRTANLFSAGDMNSMSQTFTQGISFDGNYLSSGYWNLAVTDGQGGGVTRLDSWKLAITGTPLSSGMLDLGAGAVLTAASTGTTEVGAAVVSNGTGASAITLATDSGKNLNLTGGLSGSGGFSKTGEGTVQIGNSSGFNGRLDILGGKTVIAGTLGSGSSVRVGSGARLSGTGTIGALEIASGGTLAVGNSAGQLNVAGDATWAGGGGYEWEINSFPGTAGTNWDFLNITGNLNITATSSPGSRFLIDVVSLLPGSDSFNPYANYSFAIATASAGITGFGVDKFTLSTTRFQNSYDGLWSIDTAAGPSGGSSQSLVLSYTANATAIPEPGTASLLVLGLAAILAKRRRCRG